MQNSEIIKTLLENERWEFMWSLIPGNMVFVSCENLNQVQNLVLDLASYIGEKGKYWVQVNTTENTLGQIANYMALHLDSEGWFAQTVKFNLISKSHTYVEFESGLGTVTIIENPLKIIEYQKFDSNQLQNKIFDLFHEWKKEAMENNTILIVVCEKQFMKLISESNAEHSASIIKLSDVMNIVNAVSYFYYDLTLKGYRLVRQNKNSLEKNLCSEKNKDRKSL